MNIKAPPPPPDDLPDLDDLLGVALTQAAVTKADKDLSKARAQLAAGNSGRLTPEDLARIRAWELAHDWTAVANVAVFIQHQCRCGTYNNTFEGLFIKEQHRRFPDSVQHRRVTGALARLPNETAIQVRAVDLCGDCAPAAGWNVDNPATVWADAGEEVVALGEGEDEAQAPDEAIPDEDFDEVRVEELVETTDDSQTEPELEE